MRLVLTIVLAISVLAGCASSIMSRYVGKPLAIAVSDYGFPAGAYDLGDSKRAFVWQMNNSIVIPASSTTNATVTGNQIFSTTYSSPGFVAGSVCTYTLIASKTRTDIDGPAAWTVVGFQKPRFACE